jgi:hypothetical protein
MCTFAGFDQEESADDVEYKCRVCHKSLTFAEHTTHGGWCDVCFFGLRPSKPNIANRGTSIIVQKKDLIKKKLLLLELETKVLEMELEILELLQ